MEKAFFGVEPILEEYMHPARAWKYRSQIDRAITEFLGHPSHMPPAAAPHFADWLVFDFVTQDGISIIEKFVQENPAGLSSEELRSYEEACANNRYDFFEVTGVHNLVLDLKSLRDGRSYAAHLLGDEHKVQKKDVVVCRIAKVSDTWWILSNDMLGFPRPSRKGKQHMLRAFPIMDPKFIYAEIVSREKEVSLPMCTEKISDGEMLFSGCDTHEDDDCQICEYMKKVRTEGRAPNHDELMCAFDEANNLQKNNDSNK